MENAQLSGNGAHSLVVKLRSVDPATRVRSSLGTQLANIKSDAKASSFLLLSIGVCRELPREAYGRPVSAAG